MDKDIVFVLLQNRKAWHINHNLSINLYSLLVILILFGISPWNNHLAPPAEQLIDVFKIGNIKGFELIHLFFIEPQVLGLQYP